MVIVANRRDETDGPAFQMLSSVKSSLPIVLMSKTNSFRFNDKLKSIDRYILCEFSEYGWDWDLAVSGTHIWGKNTDQFPQFNNEHYKQFDEWVASNPPVFTFKRELLRRDMTDNLQPIDYPSWHNVPDPVSKKSFDSRPIDVFYFWGRSHEARLALHSRIWSCASDGGYSVCDNIYYIEKFLESEEGRKWVSLWMPHYHRCDIKHLLSINGYAKMSIAMPGAGIKTFRHCESSLNAVMVKWVDELAWSFEWKNNINCIATSQGREIGDLLWYSEREDLYDLYVAGVENCRKYQIDNYIKHLESKINDL